MTTPHTAYYDPEARRVFGSDYAVDVPDADHGWKLAALLSFVQTDDRVCPRPIEWQSFWESLPGAERTTSGFTPAPPLVLAAWHGTSNEAKALRFREHILWASERGGIDAADQFLHSLAEEAWHHFDPRKPNY